MSDSFLPEPKKVGVWAEGTRIEAKEYVIPKKSPVAVDDIPTIPDIDDTQDIFETNVSKPPSSDQKVTETVNALAEVGVGISGNVDGIEGVLQVLNSYIPEVTDNEADTIWTVDSLLMQLVHDGDELGKR